jgi:pimeloyl-ACP methyl ester carboxylesterase
LNNANWAVSHAVEQGMFVRDYATNAGSAEAPILFVHGLGESGLCFERIVEHPKLARFPRLIVDLPGYGRSAWRRPVDTLASLADHLALWLAARAGRPAVIVGHSMGAIVALLAAERHPHLFAGVVDVDGNKSIGDCGFSGRAARIAAEEFEARGFDALVDSVYEEGNRDAPHRGYYASLRLCDPRAYHAHSIELVELSGQEQLARRLAALRLPNLYVAGQPRGACARSIALLDEAGAAWFAIEPSGHWPFLDQPDSFAAALSAFCDAVAG